MTIQRQKFKCLAVAKARHGDKAALAADLRDIFRTGQRDYTVETAWKKWQDMCERWGKDYLSITRLRDNPDYKAYLTYLNYAPEIQGIIYTKNWIERRMSGTGISRIPIDQTQIKHPQNSGRKPKLALSSGFLPLFCQNVMRGDIGSDGWRKTYRLTTRKKK